VNEVIKTKYCYDKANYDEIKKNILNDIKWSERFLNKGVEEIWKIFIDIIHDIVDTHVPKKKCLKTKHHPWVNYKVKKMIKCQSKKWNKFKATKITEDFIKYKKARNAATAAIKKTTCKFDKKLASNIKKDNKSFYRYVTSKSRTKDVVGPLKDVDGRIITDDLMMSNIFNQFFSSVFTKENSEAPEVAMRAVDDEDQGVYDITITCDMVKSGIDKLKEGKAPVSRTSHVGKIVRVFN